MTLPKLKLVALTLNEIQRFWAKVNKSGPVHPVLGTRCWLYAGAPIGKARTTAQFWIRGRNYIAPRVSWFLAHGHWPTYEACHHCDVPLCVRPDHLFDGTHADNCADAQAKGRMARGPAMPHVKATVEQVIVLRQAAHPYTVGRQMGLKHTTIHNILTGRTWKWVAS